MVHAICPNYFYTQLATCIFSSSCENAITLKAMNMSSVKKYTVIVTGMAVALAACGGPKMSKYASKTNLGKKAHYDVNRSTINKNGKGFTLDVDKLAQSPKRVALVSFYTDDPGISKVTGTAMTGKTFTTTNEGETSAKSYADFFYNASIENLKKSFADNGMTLLVPSEFLNTSDKRSYYNDFVVKHSTLNKVGGALAKFMKRLGNAGTTLECKVPADGFVLTDLNKNHEMSDAKKRSLKRNGGVGQYDDKMIECIGYDLCKKLEVDAVIVVVNSQLCDKNIIRDRHYMAAVSMYMFGPNPQPLTEGKKDNMFYSKGLFYSGYRMAFKKGLRMDPKAKGDEATKELADNNKKAYTNMILAIASKMADDVKKS